MPQDVKKGEPASFSVILVDASSGDELKGVQSSDISPIYLKKAQGGDVQEKTLVSSSFREVDSTNAPGLYEIDLAARDLSQPGELVVVIPESSSTNGTVDQTFIKLHVREHTQTDLGSHLAEVPKKADKTMAGQVKKDSAQKVHVHLNSASPSREDADFVSPGMINTEAFSNGSSVSHSWPSTFDQITDGSGNPLPGEYVFELQTSDTDTVGPYSVGLDPISSPALQTASPTNESLLASELKAQDSSTNRQRAYIAGRNNAFFYSTDSGLTWTSYSGLFADSNHDWHSISGHRHGDDSVAVGVDTGGTNNYVVYQEGANAGDPWTGFGGGTPTYNTDSVLQDVWQLTQTTGNGRAYAVGIDGQVLYLNIDDNPANSTGTEIEPPTVSGTFADTNLNGVWAYNARGSQSTDEIWVVGNNGLIQKSTDGGSTWTDLSGNGNFGTKTLQAVAVSQHNTEIGYVISQAGDVFVTRDGGQNFTHTTISANETNDLIVQNNDALITGDEHIYRMDVKRNTTTYFSASNSSKFNSLSQDVSSETLLGSKIDGSVVRQAEKFIEQWVEFDIVEYIEADTISELSTIKGGTFSASDDSLDQIRARIDTVKNTTDNTKTDTGNILTDIAHMQGTGGFDRSTDSLEEIRNLLDSKMPSKLALREHLVDGTGDINPPPNTGLWDVLGDGSVTMNTLDDDLQRALGLSKENFRISNTSYDKDDNLISANVKIYPSKMDLNNDNNLIATYKMEATYDNEGKLSDYKMVKV